MRRTLTLTVVSRLLLVGRQGLDRVRLVLVMTQCRNPRESRRSRR